MLRKYHAHICFVLIAVTLCVASFERGPGGAWHKPLQETALKFTQLSHKVDGGSEVYVTGPDDWKFVAFYATVCTLLRFIVNEALLEAFCAAAGVKEEKRGRFKDQGWQGLYYICAWITGFTLLRETDWGQSIMSGDPSPLFQDYPKGHIEISMEFKLYYLLQLCFWVHQLFVLYIGTHTRKHLRCVCCIDLL